MNILMTTNTYLPHVGGVAKSVAAFTDQLRAMGHRVIVIAPEHNHAQLTELDVLRVPAIQNFNGSDFAMIIPLPKFLESQLKSFRPDIIHSHHPFLIGNTALRLSKKYNSPLVYTQHTMFEQYTHYTPIGSPKMKHFVVALSTGYANLANRVIAPSESVARILTHRRIQTPIEVVPTGIDIQKFANGSGRHIRLQNNIPPNAFVAGTVGRLAPEKNLDFLTKAAIAFLKQNKIAHFLIAGYGPSEPQIKQSFHNENLSGRVHFLGKLEDQQLIDTYHALDCFIFSSKSETQGLVLTEAMAAGLPVIALDAPGVREVLKNDLNGFLLDYDQIEDFAHALLTLSHLPQEKRKSLSENAIKTASSFSIQSCTSKLLTVYQTALDNKSPDHSKNEELNWRKSIDQIKAEWDIITNFTSAVTDAISKDKT